MSELIPYEKLNKEQKSAADSILEWYKNNDSEQIFTLAGYAGTGKSTLIRTVVNMIKRNEDRFDAKVRYLTYTGKASIVLTLKGMPATTIHNLIYIPEGETVTEEGEEIIEFRKRDTVPSQIVLLIVDEISMVPEEILDDLESYNIKILAVGDPGQLPPVRGNRNDLIREGKYNVMLRNIHRQAKGNPIIRLSKKIREGKRISYGTKSDSNGDAKLAILKPRQVNDEMMLKADQIITGYNKTRRNINQKIRNMKGFNSILPQKGDKLICTFNNWDKALKGKLKGTTREQMVFLVNGMIGECVSGVRDTNNDFGWFRMDFRPDCFRDAHFYNLLTSESIFYGEEDDVNKLFFMDEFPNQFDYGYAVTCHKCVSGDTWVWVDDGMIQLKDILPVDLEEQKEIEFNHSIYTQYGKAETSHAFYTGEEETWKIKTRLGLELECSKRHPVQIMNEEGEREWVLAPDLEKGMRLPVSYGLEVGSKDLIKSDDIGYEKGRNNARIPKYINESLAELFGALIADGSYNDNEDYRVGFKKTDMKYFHLIKEKIEDLFEVDVSVKKCGDSLYFHNKKVRTFMFNSGIEYVIGPDKVIPKVILRSPLSIQKAFLRGLFSGDGSAGMKEKIRYKTSSEKLAEQIQLMLLNIGIISKRNVVELGDENYSDSWGVKIYSRELGKYRNEIGFLIDKKRDRLDNYNIGYMKMWGDIPGGRKYCKKLRNELRIAGGRNYPEAKSISKLLSRIINKGSRLFKRQVDMITNNIINKTESLDWFEDRLKENIFYDEIVSIEKGKNKVYDVTVPEYHEFITNGLISHNSQGSQWDNVLLYDERIPSYDSKQYRQWLYTGVTRASEGLILVTNDLSY